MLYCGGKIEGRIIKLTLKKLVVYKFKLFFRSGTCLLEQICD